MATVQIEISRSDVYDEVGKATDYTGSKMISEDDRMARDRVYAGTEDLAMMTRFWNEAIATVNESFKELLVSGSDIESGDKTTYQLLLSVSAAYDAALTQSVQSSIRSFFIMSITGNWFRYTNKPDAAEYLANASAMLQQADRLLYTRRSPSIPSD